MSIDHFSGSKALHTAPAPSGSGTGLELELELRRNEEYPVGLS